MTFRLVLRFTVLFCLSTAMASPHETTGTILGTLTDSSGAVLPGVTVTIKHIETAQTRTLVTDQAGRYRMPALSPGHYDVTARLSGFQTVVRSGIALTVGAEALVNVTMALGNVAESITVEGAAPLTGVETIKEFRVVTNAMSAEYGRSGGGVFNGRARCRSRCVSCSRTPRIS